MYFFLGKENSVIRYKRADRQHFTSFKVPVNGNQTIGTLGHTHYNLYNTKHLIGIITKYTDTKNAVI